MAKSVSTKMSIRADMRTIFIHVPTEAIEAIELPTLEVKEKLAGYFDYIHFFASDRLPSMPTYLYPPWQTNHLYS